MIRDYDHISNYTVVGEILIFSGHPEVAPVHITKGQKWQMVRENGTNEIYYYDPKYVRFVKSHPAIDALMEED